MMMLRWSPMMGQECMNSCFGDSDESWKPSTDIYDTKENFVLKMDLPGVSKEDVNVEFKDNVLTVTGERKDGKKEDDSCLCATERASGKFSRSFKFPENIDGDKIDASMKDGILELKVAKPEERKPRTIPIAA
jgi:HSP20 family protein